MRNRGGKPDADRRHHHLPEPNQRRGRAGFFAERGQRLRGAQRVHDAHAEHENAHRRQEGKEAGAEQRHQQDRDAAHGRREQAALDRAVEPVAWHEPGRQHAGGEHDHDGAGEKQSELDRGEVQRFDQYARCG